MESSSPQRGFHPVLALFYRRRRRVWVYVLWLLAYIITNLLYAELYRVENLRPSDWLLPILVPAVVVMAQIIYPTIFVWAVISLPTVFIAGVRAYELINDIGRIQGPSDFFLELFAVSVSVGTCVGLILFRPRLLEKNG